MRNFLAESETRRNSGNPSQKTMQKKKFSKSITGETGEVYLPEAAHIPLSSSDGDGHNVTCPKAGKRLGIVALF